ncbi:hypothetical protein CYMTET_14771 [Cymbomonas tetramitiformis]|uniref:Histone deacetylase domain-containing protein n=1 Tax=Cymbomonas tetramitiformis TaxID=36881 RepID=A0AAE0GFR5_9CHLO|nr:hypothetical protein CYMTET_14771 [Cymbomonas tetramitiformis]
MRLRSKDPNYSGNFMSSKPHLLEQFLEVDVPVVVVGTYHTNDPPCVTQSLTRQFCRTLGDSPHNQRVTSRRLSSNVGRAFTQGRPPMPIFYADWAEVILPNGHRFPMDKYRATRELLQDDRSLTGMVEFIRSPLAFTEDITRVHDEDYVSRDASELAGWATGGTLAATYAVLQDPDISVAAQVAGGTHHAFAGHGEGFCVFNDIAVAIKSAISTLGEEAVCPVLVIDLDVHQGNGTAKIFEDDPRIVTFSMHGANNYPWKTRMKSTYDIELDDKTDDARYNQVLAEWLPHLFEVHEPRLVFYQAGVDALHEDSFGRLGMTRDGLMRRNEMVYSECIKRQLPLVITMGGGYSRPMDASVAAHADVFRCAAIQYASNDAIE